MAESVNICGIAGSKEHAFLTFTLDRLFGPISGLSLRKCVHLRAPKIVTQP
jgi:hypothetical protein